ncbi:MAG: PA2778 family cysteine peptidase [Luteimonas sp.]|nr:PA2778 family cysteine peptidase [Luteimonas sp.]
MPRPTRSRRRSTCPVGRAACNWSWWQPRAAPGASPTSSTRRPKPCSPNCSKVGRYWSLQNLWVRTVPRWHYAVLVGSDPARNRVILNSGETRGMTMRAPPFLRTWDWAGRWAMVSLRPGELPANADATRYLGAVADFEAVAGADAAEPAYQAALQAWPRDHRPHLALGNQSHAGGDRVAAARHYRAGLALAHDDPVLGNNLASTLSDLGCRVEARAAVRHALQAMPAEARWREALERTESEIDRGGRARDPVCDTLR